jgi:hypothetical protein
MGKSDRGSRSGRLTIPRLTSSRAFRSERLHFGFECIDAGSISLDRLDQTVDYRVQIMISRVRVGTSKFSSSPANKIKIRFFR